MRYTVSMLVAAVLAAAALTACAPEGNFEWSEGAERDCSQGCASRPAFFTSRLEWGNDGISGGGGPGFVFEVFVLPPPNIYMSCNTRIAGPGGNTSGNGSAYAANDYCRSFTRSEWRGSGTYTGFYYGRFTILSAGWYWYRVFNNPACYTGPERIVAVCDGQRYQYYGPSGEMRTSKVSNPAAEFTRRTGLAAVPKACAALSPRSLRKLHPKSKCAQQLPPGVRHALWEFSGRSGR